jgi:predicted small integral membrane protein
VSGVALVSTEYMSVLLVLGGIALFRARQADIPAVLDALRRWLLRR